MIERFFGCISGWITEWGPGLLIALIMLFGLYKLLFSLGQNVGIKIIAALDNPSQALNKQATSMERMTASLEEYISRDQSAHREIIILQKVTNERLENVLERLEGIRDERNKKGTL